MSLNTMRESFKRSAPWVMGIVTAAMVITTFSGFGNNTRNGVAPAAASSGDDVIATVNGLEIKRAEYTNQIENQRQQQSMTGQPSSIMENGIMAFHGFEQIVQAKLEMQAAEKQGLTVSDADLKKKREEIATMGDLRTKLSLPKTATLDDIDATLTKNGALTLSQRFPDDDLRQEILLQKLKDKITGAVPVTEQDVRNSYRQFHTRHILIDNKKVSDEQALKNAQDILAKAKAPGADFVSLAKQYSQDPGTKDKGGDDGWIDNNTPYDEAFKKAAFTLQKGQVTPDLVKSPQFGYFIIKLDDIRDNLPKDFEKNKKSLIDQYTQTEQGKAWQTFEQGVKADPSVKLSISDPEVRAGHTLSQAIDALQTNDKPKSDALMKAAMADYSTALAKDPKGADATTINIVLGQIATQLKQNKDAIKYYSAALATNDDAQLRMVLGKAYMDDKDNANALTQFQAASKLAWDDQQVHQMLLNSYQQLKRPDLVATEQKWLVDYQKQHPQPAMNFGGPGGPGGPGGAPVVVPSPSGAPAGKIHVGAPTAAGVKATADTAPPAPAPKPAQ